MLSDIFIILDKVQFEKNSYINRNKIKTSSGSNWLTVPVSLEGHTENTISDIKISGQKWALKHWKTIELNYRKSPYFKYYQNFFEELYKKKWVFLIDLLNAQMDFFFKELKIKTKIFYQSKLSFVKKKQDLLIEICKHFNANAFIFGELGKKYIDNNLFDQNNIRIYFQNYVYPSYPQLHGNFIPKLSIIDLIFNVGPEKALEYIIKDNISKISLKKKLQILT